MVIMDRKEKESSSEELGEIKKCCADCKTTKTPLWRGGPAGPKTLCNACGIRYRKRRASGVRLNKGQERKRDRAQCSGGGGGAANAVTTAASPTCTTATTFAKTVGVGGSDLKESLKMNIMGLGEEVLLQRTFSVLKKQRCQRKRKLGEEEQAAFCLMALSSGFVFA